ncbi:MAG TPA: RNA polymerase sigma factor [Planctomycetota bacterium]
MDPTRAEFERRVLPLERDLYFGARALTGREAEALDLTQDTLLRAWRGFATYARDENLKAWLFTILRHAWTDRCRRQKIEPAALDPEIEVPSPPATDDSLPDELLRALRSLSPAHQMLVLLRDIEGLSYKEVAAAMDIPMGSVMSGLHNARKKLREALEAQ